MARLGARIRKGTMETMKTLGTAAVARSPMTPVTNVAKAFSVPGMLPSPTVGQGLKTTNGNMVRLGDVATYINGYAFKPADWSMEGVLIIRIQDLTGNSYKANRFKGKIDKRYEVLNGDVLISWSASLGVYVWSGEKAVLNQHIFKVQFDKTQVDKSFFVHQVECILKRAIGEAHGATMKHLTKPAFDALPFYLPDIQKQKAIADSLDKISHLIALRKRQLAKLDELVKSRFVEMFGDPVSNPKKWNVCRMREFADVRIGPFGSLLHKEDYIQGGHPLVNPSHMINGKIVPDNDLTLSESKYKELGVYKLRPNDIVIARRGEIGRCALVESEGFFCGTGSMFVRIIKDCRADYLQRVISYPTFAARLEDAAVGITMKNINAGMIENCLVPLPPLALQREFAAFVEKVDKLEFKAKASLEKLETLKKAMMQKYFG